MEWRRAYCVCGKLLFERLAGERIDANGLTRVICANGCKRRVYVRDSDLKVVRVDGRARASRPAA